MRVVDVRKEAGKVRGGGNGYGARMTARRSGGRCHRAREEVPWRSEVHLPQEKMLARAWT